MTRSSLLQHLASLWLPLRWSSVSSGPDHPDYSPPPNLAYPTTPSSYVAIGTGVFLNSTTPTALHNFTDGKLYLLKSLTLNGSYVNTSSTTNAAPMVTVQLTQGLTGNGVSSIIAGVRGWTQNTTLANPQELQWVWTALDGPLIFQSGSVATPNALTISGDSTSATVFFEGVFTLLCWPLN